MKCDRNWVTKCHRLTLTSDISIWRNYANTLARPALWSANDVEEAGIHIDCRSRHRAGHRRRHDYLQRCGRDYVAAFFFSEPETVGDAPRTQSGDGNHARFGVAGKCYRAR